MGGGGVANLHGSHVKTCVAGMICQIESRARPSERLNDRHVAVCRGHDQWGLRGAVQMLATLRRTRAHLRRLRRRGDTDT